MFATRVMIGFIHLAAMCVLTLPLVYVTYRVFVRANADFDIESEIKRNNAAAGLVAGVILYCAAQFLLVGAESSLQLFTTALLAPSQYTPSWMVIAAVILAHLAFSLLLAVVVISLALRLFLRSMRHLELGNELRRGNMAAALFISSVLLVSTLLVKEGAVSLARALRPHHQFARVQVQP